MVWWFWDSLGTTQTHISQHYNQYYKTCSETRDGRTPEGKKALHVAEWAARAHDKGLDLRISQCFQQLTSDKDTAAHVTSITRTLKISELENLPQSKEDEEN